MCIDKIGCKLRHGFMEHIVATEQMKSLEALANINLKVSAIKGVLLELESTEKNYIEEREKKVYEKVAQALKESEELINRTRNNYEDVKSFHNETSTIVGFLQEMYGKYTTFVERFEERSKVWEETYTIQLNEIAEMRKEVENREKVMESEKTEIEKMRKKIQEDRMHIESQQQTLTAGFEEIKKLRK